MNCRNNSHCQRHLAGADTKKMQATLQSKLASEFPFSRGEDALHCLFSEISMRAASSRGSEIWMKLQATLHFHLRRSALEISRIMRTGALPATQRWQLTMGCGSSDLGSARMLNMSALPREHPQYRGIRGNSDNDARPNSGRDRRQESRRIRRADPPRPGEARCRQKRSAQATSRRAPLLRSR